MYIFESGVAVAVQNGIGPTAPNDLINDLQQTTNKVVYDSASILIFVYLFIFSISYKFDVKMFAG